MKNYYAERIADSYWYTENDTVIGPVDADVIRGLHPTTLIRKEGQTNWTRAAALFPVQYALPSEGGKPLTPAQPVLPTEPPPAPIGEWFYLYQGATKGPTVFTPSSARIYPIADGNHPIDRCDTVVDVPTGENLLAVKIFYCLPTVKPSVQSRENRVFRKERAEGCSVAFVERLVILRGQCTNLLLHFWIDRVLSEGRRNKADCETC
jgi:hypothetical protein